MAALWGRPSLPRRPSFGSSRNLSSPANVEEERLRDDEGSKRASAREAAVHLHF